MKATQFEYNARSQTTAVVDALNQRYTFAYDALGRTTETTRAGVSMSYGYDAVGNRTQRTDYNGAVTNYTYDNLNRLTTITYPNWDSENRLKQVTLPGGLSVSYKYDALGRRIQRTTSAGADERFVYDGQDVLLDLNSSLAVTTSYINGLGIDNHLRQTNATTGVSYFLTDHLGSTAALTDANGNVVEQLSYDSFGNSAGSSRTRYTYTGREHDPLTGQIYYRARFYDPQVGRFTAEDPLEFHGGKNWYLYVDNSPISWIDPFGWAKLFYWSPYHNSKKGHAALILDDGTYISYWPTCEDEFTWDPQPFQHCPSRPPNYDKDVEGEGGRRPEEIPIEGLDEAAIKRWWNDGKGHGDFSLRNNCSDIVGEALRVGGLPIPKPLIYTTPDYIKRRVKEEMQERQYPPRPLPAGVKPWGCNSGCK